MSPMDSPVQFVLMADAACCGAAVLIVLLGLLTGRVLNRVAAAGDRLATMKKGMGNERAQKV